MKRTIWIILSIVATVVLLMTGLYMKYKTDLKPLATSGAPVVIEIPNGTSGEKIGEILEDNQIIRSGKAFYVYAKGENRTDFKAGKYQLNGTMKIDKIIEILESGKVYQDSVKVTIPEGYTVEEIAGLIEEKGLTTKKDFLQVLDNTKYQGITSEIPAGKPIRHRLEGFLFPKTYMIDKDSTVEGIAQLLLDQFIKEVPDEWIPELRKRNMNLFQAVTLASIVERETVNGAERGKVAQVYYNRMKKGMKLQADATVQYALGQQKDRVLYSDLEIESPYNTYKYKGLPIGPIANPGLESIKAVVYPTPHDYLYYVTKKDGSGQHYFSKTYEEHKKYIKISKENARNE